MMELACAEQPISFVKGLTMRPYQLQALGWMIERYVCVSVYFIVFVCECLCAYFSVCTRACVRVGVGIGVPVFLIIMTRRETTVGCSVCYSVMTCVTSQLLDNNMNTIMPQGETDMRKTRK